MVREVNSNRRVLFTSVVTKTEVLQNRLGSRAKTKFSNIFKRSNVSLIAQDEPIADRSHSIRSHYDKKGYRLSTTDSIHLTLVQISF